MTTNISLEFLETFVLSESEAKRSELLTTLPRNSLEYFYYSILYEQLQSPDVETERETKLMKEFSASYSNRSSEFRMFKLRRYLLEYENAREDRKSAIMQYLRQDIFHLQYNQSAPTVGSSGLYTNKEVFPCVVDAEVLSFDKVAKVEVGKQNRFISTLTPEGLFRVSSNEFQKNNDLDFIRNVPYSTFPSSLNHVLNLLRNKVSYSELGMKFTAEQLETIQKEYPNVFHESEFVRDCINALRETGEVDWSTDIAAKDAFFEKLWDFSLKLPSYLRECSLALQFQCIQNDWERGRVNKKKFDVFIQQPQTIMEMYLYPSDDKDQPDRFRSKLYSLEKYMSMDERMFNIVNAKMESSSLEKTVYEILVQLFTTAADTKPYNNYLHPAFLHRAFIEAKLLSGTPLPVALDSDVDHSFVSRVTNRVEFRFARDNTLVFPTEDVDDSKADVPNSSSTSTGTAVRAGGGGGGGGGGSSSSSGTARSEEAETGKIPSIVLELKNVKEVSVQLFEINTQAYYRDTQQEVDTSIDLDGLLASHRIQLDFSAIAPAVRHRETIPLPPLVGRRGVFIAEVSADGQVMRAILRKGCLRMVSRALVDGHAVTVIDEHNSIVPRERAAVWVDGQKFDASTTPKSHPSLEAHELLLPYSPRPSSRQQAVVQDVQSGFCSLTRFKRLSENYQFSCGIYVDREELIRHTTAHILLRPQLSCNGLPAAPESVQHVTATITAVDVESIPTTTTIDNLAFTSSGLTVIEYDIPEKLSSLSISVNGIVTIHSDLGRKQEVHAEKTLRVNGIDGTKQIVASAVRQDAKRGYVLCIFGKSGEVISGHVCTFAFHFRCLKTTEFSKKGIRLQTDEHGEITLGPLSDISTFSVTYPNGNGTETSTDVYGVDEYANSPSDTASQLPTQFVAMAGTELRLPYFSTNPASDRRFLNLLLFNHQNFLAHDLTSSLQFDENTGELVLPPTLVPGHYRVYDWKANTTIQVILLTPAAPLPASTPSSKTTTTTTTTTSSSSSSTSTSTSAGAPTEAATLRHRSFWDVCQLHKQRTMHLCRLCQRCSSEMGLSLLLCPTARRRPGYTASLPGSLQPSSQRSSSAQKVLLRRK